jgi:hypothetical protein
MSEPSKEIQIDDGMLESPSRTETAASIQRTIDRSIDIPISSVSWLANMLSYEINQPT